MPPEQTAVDVASPAQPDQTIYICAFGALCTNTNVRHWRDMRHLDDPVQDLVLRKQHGVSDLDLITIPNPEVLVAETPDPPPFEFTFDDTLSNGTTESEDPPIEHKTDPELPQPQAPSVPASEHKNDSQLTQSQAPSSSDSNNFWQCKNCKYSANPIRLTTCLICDIAEIEPQAINPQSPPSHSSPPQPTSIRPPQLPQPIESNVVAPVVSINEIRSQLNQLEAQLSQMQPNSPTVPTTTVNPHTEPATTTTINLPTETVPTNTINPPTETVSTTVNPTTTNPPTANPPPPNPPPSPPSPSLPLTAVFSSSSADEPILPGPTDEKEANSDEKKADEEKDEEKK
eukprot:477048_1